MLHIYFISYILHSVTFVIFYSLEVNKGPARIQAEGIKTVNTMRQGLWGLRPESFHYRWVFGYEMMTFNMNASTPFLKEIRTYIPFE